MDIDLQKEFYEILENHWESKPLLRARFQDIFNKYVNSMEDIFPIYEDIKKKWADNTCLADNTSLHEAFFEDFELYLAYRIFKKRKGNA